MNSEKQQLNLELIELIEQIKQFPPNSRERRKLLDELIKIIEPKLKSISPKICNGQDEFLIEDARQETYINIQKYIHTYDPERRKFINWVVHIFEKNFYKLSEKHKKKGMTYVPSQKKANSSEKPKKLQVISLDTKNYDDLPASDNKEQTRRMWEFLKADPENILKHTKIRNHDLSLQEISLMKFEGYTFREIGEYYSISDKTVSSFYERNLKKLEIKQYFSRHLDEDYLT